MIPKRQEKDKKDTARLGVQKDKKDTARLGVRKFSKIGGKFVRNFDSGPSSLCDLSFRRFVPAQVEVVSDRAKGECDDAASPRRTVFTG